MAFDPVNMYSHEDSEEELEVPSPIDFGSVASLNKNFFDLNATNMNEADDKALVSKSLENQDAFEVP